MLTSNIQQTPYGVYMLGYGGYERCRDTNLITWRIDKWIGGTDEILRWTMVTGADDSSPVNTMYCGKCNECWLNIVHSTDLHSKSME